MKKRKLLIVALVITFTSPALAFADTTTGEHKNTSVHAINCPERDREKQILADDDSQSNDGTKGQNTAVGGR